MTETKKSMADWFRRAERAAEEEKRDAERQRLEAELAETKRRSPLPHSTPGPSTSSSSPPRRPGSRRSPTPSPSSKKS